MALEPQPKAALAWTKASAPRRPQQVAVAVPAQVASAAPAQVPPPRQAEQGRGAPSAEQAKAQAPRQDRIDTLHRKLAAVAPNSEAASKNVFETLCWRNGHRSDWSLRLGQRTYAVHKAIVGYGQRASSLLKDAFDAGDRGARPTETDLSRMCPEAVWPLVDAVLDFVYTGKFELKTDALVGMLLWADVLQIKVLYEHVAHTAKNIFCKVQAAAPSAPPALDGAVDGRVADAEGSDDEYEDESSESESTGSRSVSSAGSVDGTGRGAAGVGGAGQEAPRPVAVEPRRPPPSVTQRTISPPPGDFGPVVPKLAPAAPQLAPAARPAMRREPSPARAPYAATVLVPTARPALRRELSPARAPYAAPAPAAPVPPPAARPALRREPSPARAPAERQVPHLDAPQSKAALVRQMQNRDPAPARMPAAEQLPRRQASPPKAPPVRQAPRCETSPPRMPARPAPRREPSPLKAPPTRQAPRREASPPRTSPREKDAERGNADKGHHEEASPAKAKANDDVSVGGPQPKGQVRARAMASTSGAQAKGRPTPVPIGSRAKASLKRPPESLQETPPPSTKQATSRQAKRITDSLAEDFVADGVPAGLSSAPTAAGTKAAASASTGAVLVLPVEPPPELIAVRAENTWEKLTPPDSAGGAVADSAESRRREVRLRVFTSDREVWRFPVTHTCVIFGSAADSAHFADLTHPDVKSQHAALTLRTSNRFALEPINGKTRVRPAWSIPVVARVLEGEGRPRPGAGEEEPLDAELLVGGTRQILTPGLSCFQLGKSQLTLFLDFSEDEAASASAGGSAAPGKAPATSSAAHPGGSGDAADAGERTRSRSGSNAQSSSASAASGSPVRLASQQSKRSRRSHPGRSEPSVQRGSSPGAATDEEENTWRSERVAMRMSSTNEEEKGPARKDPCAREGAGAGEIPPNGSGDGRRYVRGRRKGRPQTYRGGHRDRSPARGGAEAGNSRRRPPGRDNQHRGRDRWRSRSRGGNFRGRDRPRGNRYQT